MSDVEIVFDHSYLYRNQRKFFPIIQEQMIDFEMLDSVNGVLISIDCCGEEVEWGVFHEQAQYVVSLGKYITWELDFHFRDKPLFIEDSSSFFSYSLILEEFVENLWKPFQEYGLGVFLFRGSCDFLKYFLWTEQHERHYQEKIQDYPLLQSDRNSEEMLRRIFAADVFSEYIHRLASFLPAEALAFCLIDVLGERSNAVLAFLLSKERFQHLLLALKGAKICLGHLNWQEGGCLGGWIGKEEPYFSTVSEVSTAVCLPTSNHLSKKALLSLDETFLELARFTIPFRVIDESRLHECWDGIDDLVVLSSCIGEEGIRKLRGFAAAGGRIVTVGPSLFFENEISLSELTKDLTVAEVLF